MIGVVPEESTFLLSWWFLLPCLLVSGFAAYLLVESTKAGDYPSAHYLLTVALAPILLVSVYAAAIALSGAVFEFLETPQPASQSPSTAPAASENTRPESTSKDTHTPKTTLTTEDESGSSPSASPSASPTAPSTPRVSPTAPSTASPSAAPSASPAVPASATASASSAAPAP